MEEGAEAGAAAGGGAAVVVAGVRAADVALFVDVDAGL